VPISSRRRREMRPDLLGHERDQPDARSASVSPSTCNASAATVAVVVAYSALDHLQVPVAEVAGRRSRRRPERGVVELELRSERAKPRLGGLQPARGSRRPRRSRAGGADSGSRAPRGRSGATSRQAFQRFLGDWRPLGDLSSFESGRLARDIREHAVGTGVGP
jgi:hypothetical protein